jgi:superfamily II DNA helicase RecQ
MHLDFLGWCQSLISEGKLDRIIIDECHLVPEADSYRKYMREVFHLRKLAIPLVLTTATLTKASERGLIERLGLMQPIMVRESINQPNIHYSVKIFKAADQAKQFQELLQFLLGFNPSSQPPYDQFRTRSDMAHPQLKGIIYFQYINDLERFYQRSPKLFGKYHGKLTEAERSSQLNDFLKGLKPFLLATSALGAGFDFLGVYISLVVFYLQVY